ncbi:MAG: coproporphyrinogen dehydrogenase HemZ [Clostridiaceae bacterium]|nr:coproporphyrinogen dehydrogenase HemZ [Clostridiaceae bacterium]
MITLRIIGHHAIYPVSDVVRLFFGPIRMRDTGEIQADCDEDLEIISQLENIDIDGTKLQSQRLSTLINGKCICSTTIEELPLNREVKRSLYNALSIYTGRKFPWGSLTGIRPTVVAREVTSDTQLNHLYGVRSDKARLSIITASHEDEVMRKINKSSLSIYIGIPFCPTRCSYCSFPAHDMSSGTDTLNEYVEALLKEMELLQHLFQNIDSVYFGGGTPTVLTDELFEAFINRAFSLLSPNAGVEVTLEAGRPDTITKSKLNTAKKNGFNRICINPQTLNNQTLRNIGRNHSVEDFLKAYSDIRQMGFNTVNADLIAGLPGESYSDFTISLNTLAELKPENITVHSLYKKRTAMLSRDEVMKAVSMEDIDRMLQYSHNRLPELGYIPYYLYKQKDTLGGHENTGYSFPGDECRYNVAMMSDAYSVLAIGAGGVSKRVFSDRRLVRCDCVKNPAEYIRRVKEMAERKLRFFDV